MRQNLCQSWVVNRVSLEYSAIQSRYDEYGVEMLTIDGKIILFLLEKGEAKIKELMLMTGSSYRGFYLAYNRLKDKNILVSSVDPQDRRSRIAKLAPLGSG